MNVVVGIIVAALVLGGAALAWRAGGPPGSRWAVWTPVRILVVGYLVLDGIGAIALAATTAATGGPFLIGAGFVAIGAGAALVRVIAGPPAIPTSVVAGPIRVPVVLVLVAVGLAMYAWLAVDYGVPLLSNDAQAARLGWGGARLDLFRWLVPPAALLFLGFALASRRRDLTVLAAGALAAVAALEIAAASRALPLELGLAGLLVAAWAGRRVSRGGWLLVGGAAGLVFFGVLFARVAPEGSFRDPLDAAGFAVNRAIERVVMIQPRTVEVVVIVYQGEEPYLAGGTYFRWLDSLRGVEPAPPLGTELFRRLFPNEPPGGFVAPGLLAEAHANFGPIFAFLVMVGLGVAAALVGRWLPRLPPDPATLSFVALLVVALLRTYATSLNGFLLTAAAAVGWWLLVEPGAVGRLRATARAHLQPPSGGR